MCTQYLKNKRLCDFPFHLANQKPLGLYWKITRYSLYLFSYLQRHLPTTRSIHTPTGLDSVPCFILWKEEFEMSGEHIHDQYPWKPSELIACVERRGSQEEIRCPLMSSFRTGTRVQIPRTYITSKRCVCLELPALVVSEIGGEG